MDNTYIRGLRLQKKSVIKRLYAAVCMVLVAALLVSTSSYAWLVLSQAPEVTGVNTALGANGNLEIALNTNSIGSYIFTANEEASIDIESVFESNSYWGNVVELSDERYGLQNVQLKPAALNYKSEAQLAVNMGSPFLVAQYGLDGRVTNLSSSGILTNFDSKNNKFIPSTSYGVRALGDANKALNTLPVGTNQDDAAFAVYITYKAIADENSPEVSYQDWPAWREAVWNILLRIYFKHSDAIANGTTASESYPASTVNELETQYLIMQENIDKAYTYLQAMVICRVFADGSSLVAQAKIADLISNNEEDVREYFAAAGITDYNEALDLLDETKVACNGVLSAISSFKDSSAYSSGSISYDQIRNLLLSDLDLNNITFNGNSIGAYDIASYAASRYAYCLLNKTDTLDSLYGNSSYNFSSGSSLNFMSALESIHTVAMYEYAGKLYYDGYSLTIPSYANNTELRGMTYETFMNPHNGHVRHLSWAYPYLTDSTNTGTSTNTEFYKQAYADAKTALLEAFYIPEDPEYSAFITPAFDHIISVANSETDTYAYEYLARLEAGLDALTADFLNRYGEGIKYYALMFAALISDAEYAEGASITEPAPDSLYAKVLQAIYDGKSADEVLAISGYLDYEYIVGNPPNSYYFKRLIGDPYAYMKTAIADAYAQIDALKASKATGEALSWEEIYSVIVFIIGEEFAPYNGDYIEYLGDCANCSIVLDVPSKAIGSIHTLLNDQDYACDFTLSEVNITASSYDSFMERLITANVGILPEKKTYWVCIYRWDIPEYGRGNFELNSNGTIYAFGIDLLFRTNATAANLLLQTIGIDRIYNNDNAPEEWIYSDQWEDAQGQGSRITMENPELLAALRVVFTDTATGEIYGVAKADSDGYLYLSNDDGSAAIKPLGQNVISAITAWIYLDGNIVKNLHAATAAATDMKINLQFATDATLNPAFSGNSETPNGGTQTPTTPVIPEGPDTPSEGGDVVQSTGLEYTLSEDGSYYVLSGIGTCTDTNIVIPDTHNGKPVKGIEASAFSGESNINSVVVPNSVTSIGSGAFSGCSGLTSIDIPDGVTSIGNAAFYNCSSLTAVNLPEGIDRINSQVFNDCSSLTSVTIPDSVISIGYHAFSGSGITSITIPDSVLEIDTSAFVKCKNLYSASIGNNVTSIGETAFYYCDKLLTVTIGAKVATIGENAFAGCEHLFEVYNLSALDITCGSSEYGGVAQYALDVYTTANAESKLFEDDRGFVFYESGETCYLLTYRGNEKHLTLPTNCHGKNYEIYQDAFHHQDGLISVNIPNGVTKIGEAAFAGCENLRTVSIPESLTYIHSDASNTSGYGAFSNCYNLLEVYDFSTLNITTGSRDNGGLGYYAKNIYTGENADSKIFTDSNGYVFYENDDECFLIDYEGAEPELILPLSCNGKNYTIYQSAFANQSHITKVTIPSSVTAIGAGAFRNCEKLADIRIADSVISIGSGAFSGCSNLCEIIIPESVASLDDAFWGCETLINIIVDAQNTTYASHEGNLLSKDNTTFLFCPRGKTTCKIPASVSTIGQFAFFGHPNLRTVQIPYSVHTIEVQAFADCHSLSAIEYDGSISDWHSISKDASWWDEASENCIVYCYDGEIPSEEA